MIQLTFLARLMADSARWAARNGSRRRHTGALAVCLAGLVMTSKVTLAEQAPSPATLPQGLPAQLPDTVPGKIDQVEKALQQADYPEAGRAAIAAVTQSLRQARVDSSKMTLFATAVQSLLQVASAAKEAGDYQTAAHCYSQARSVRSDLSEPILGLAEVARLTGQSWEAFRLYGDYLKVPATERPQDERAHLGLGLVCLSLGQNSTALYHLKRATQIAPNNAEALMALARAQWQCRKWKDAVKTGERAVAIDDQQPEDKRNPQYRYWLSHIYNDAGEFDKGLEACRRSNAALRDQLKRYPKDLGLLNDMERGLDLHSQLLNKVMNTPTGRQNPSLHLELASVIEAQGAIKQIRHELHALELLTGAVEAFPKNADLLLAVGRLARLVGDSETAIGAYQAILKIDPDRAQAKEALREMGAPLQSPTTTAAGPVTE